MMKLHRNLLILTSVSLITGTAGFVLAQTVPTTSGQTDVVAQNSPQPGQQEGCRGHRRPDFAAAAQQLGVTEAELIQALGLPAEPPANSGDRPQGARPRLDIPGAAQRLGVTEEQLVEALGIPRRPPGDRPNTQTPASGS
ncbi:hypothetical protein H6G89_24725 [Oscillatoria sp. FACHB-1407]|uniref:hypothetical protein n=1 Tax=Oscillatoria sp. FACHB-1407 TaxID=2692847 RepID=UPI001681F02B|nr:hypothetical protein [Oscillatoria sp. FACHB-1407]MBD2464212.1 hypothetical protein [Oscillatoria sp. FACHB-1407]